MSKLRTPFKYTFFNATLIVVLVNVAFYILVNHLHLVPQTYLGVSVVGLLNGFWWTPLTYLFTHADFSHIFFNMFALAVFGMSVERAIGSKEFLLFYFVCGIADGLVSAGIYYLAILLTGRASLGYIFIVGASGAIYAVLLAYAVIFPKSRIFIWGILPIPAPLLVLLYAIIAFLGQFGTGNVAHVTHLAGFALAWLYLFIRMGLHPLRIWKDAYKR